MTQASPQHRVAASSGVRISSTAGRIRIVSAGIFSGGDDRFVRTLVRSLFRQDAVRLVRVDRTRTCVDIHYDDSVLDPHTALTFFSTTLRSAASDNPPSPVDDFLQRVPGNLCRVERRRPAATPRTAASIATERVLSSLQRFARNGAKPRDWAGFVRAGKSKTILTDEKFVIEYREAPQLLDGNHRGVDGNGIPIMRLWEANEPESIDVRRRKWIGTFALVDVYRLGNLAAAGGCFVLAVIGFVTPGIPTVPFVLATSYFLARSSPALNERLKQSELFGQMIRDWQQHRALRASTKIKTVVLTLVIMGVTVAIADVPPALLLGLLAMGGLGTYMVLRIPTLPNESRTLPAMA